MVRIRLNRMGRVHRPFFRINAVDKRSPRDGKVLEQLGWYDPLQKDPAKSIKLNVDRIKHWLSKGAQPSDTMNDILARHGLIDAEAWRKKRQQRAEAVVAGRAKAAAAPPKPKGAAKPKSEVKAEKQPKKDKEEAKTEA